MRIVFRVTLMIAMLAPITHAFADANGGDLFGYTLGDRYREADNKPRDDGRLVLIATQNPLKPDAIEKVYVLTTPLSRSIGKIAGETWFASGEDAIVAYERFRSILRNKYSHWESEEQSEMHFQGVRFSSGDYVLSVQASGPHRDNAAKISEKPFQFLITLSYSPATDAAIEFEALANEEIEQMAAEKYSEDEVRGL